MKKRLKNYIMYVLVYLLLDSAYLIYYYMKHNIFNIDFIRSSLISILVYTIIYFGLIIIFGWRE